MVGAMADVNILAELDGKAAHHESVAVENAGLAKAYRDAAALIRRSTGAAAVERVLAKHGSLPVSVIGKAGRKSGPNSTMSMIRTVLRQSLGSLSVADLTDKMLQAGWDTTSEVPQNTVRTALARLVEKSEVQRNEDGTYAQSAAVLVGRALGTREDEEYDESDD